MLYRKPYYYSQFKCIADKCPASCCEGWGIVIDDKTMERYYNLPTEEKEYVLSQVDNEEGMFIRSDGRCSFLNDNNLCDLYILLGEEGFCNTCKRYPRHFEEYGNVIEAALSMSCPVAAKMIVANPKSDRYVEYSNDKKSPHSDEVDYVLLSGLLGAREHIIDIINNRTLPLQLRIKRVYRYSAKVQKLIYNYEALGRKVKKSKCVSEFLLKMDMLKKKELIYSDKNYSFKKNDIKSANKEYENSADDSDFEYQVNHKRQEQMREVIDIISLLENINADWPKMTDELKNYLYVNMSNEQYMSYCREFEEYMRDRSYEYEHIFNYFIYTYYLGGVYDFNVHAMTKLALISVEIIRDLGMFFYIKNGRKLSCEEQLRICYSYSRQIEHSDENLISIEGLLNAHPKLDDKSMIKIM